MIRCTNRCEKILASAKIAKTVAKMESLALGALRDLRDPRRSLRGLAFSCWALGSVFLYWFCGTRGRELEKRLSVALLQPNNASLVLFKNSHLPLSLLSRSLSI